jgi:predicted DNA-binding transcriptional regulator AlpA
MDVKQASEQLGVSRAMVYKLAAPHHRDGGTA